MLVKFAAKIAERYTNPRYVGALSDWSHAVMYEIMKGSTSDVALQAKSMMNANTHKRMFALTRAFPSEGFGRLRSASQSGANSVDAASTLSCFGRFLRSDGVMVWSTPHQKMENAELKNTFFSPVEKSCEDVLARHALELLALALSLARAAVCGVIASETHNYF